MREIKFRQWYDGEMRLLDQMHVGIGQIGFSDTFYADVNDNDREICRLMQYTGLKDKNGVEIYEGDILGWQSQVAQVEWSPGDADYLLEDKVLGGFETRPTLNGLDSVRSGYYEVIGNIYESPELLDTTKETTE